MATTIYSKASKPTLSTTIADFGSAITISTNRQMSLYVHTLTAKMYSDARDIIASVTIGTQVGESCSWTIPSAWMNLLSKTSSNARIVINCVTYANSISSSQIGENSVYLTATLPLSKIPLISSVTVRDEEGYAENFNNNYIQNLSKAYVEVEADGVCGSTIVSYDIVVNNKSYTSNPCIATLPVSGTIPITVTVTDSRGRTATASTSIVVASYASPAISLLTAVRCNSNGDENEAGSYMKITATAKVSAINNYNTGTFVLKYKAQNDSADYGSYTVSAINYSKEYIISANASQAYNIELIVTDKLNNTKSLSISLPTTFVIMDWNGNGDGISFGKKSTQSGFDCAMDATFRSGVTTYEDIINASDRRLKSNIEDIDDKYVSLLNSLSPKVYNFNDNEDLSIGLIAQDVENAMKENEIPINMIIKELKGTNGYLGINYTGLIPILIYGYQNLKKQLDEMKEIIAAKNESEAIYNEF